MSRRSLVVCCFSEKSETYSVVSLVCGAGTRLLLLWCVDFFKGCGGERNLSTSLFTSSLPSPLPHPFVPTGVVLDRPQRGYGVLGLCVGNFVQQLLLSPGYPRSPRVVSGSRVPPGPVSSVYPSVVLCVGRPGTPRVGTQSHVRVLPPSTGVTRGATSEIRGSVRRSVQWTVGTHETDTGGRTDPSTDSGPAVKASVRPSTPTNA